MAGRVVQPTAYRRSRAPKAPERTDIGLPTASACSAILTEPHRDDDRDSQTCPRHALSLIWVRFFRSAKLPSPSSARNLSFGAAFFGDLKMIGHAFA